MVVGLLETVIVAVEGAGHRHGVGLSAFLLLPCCSLIRFLASPSPALPSSCPDVVTSMEATPRHPPTASFLTS
jgi:hypothetical protein